MAHGRHHDTIAHLPAYRPWGPERAASSRTDAGEFTFAIRSGSIHTARAGGFRRAMRESRLGAGGSASSCDVHGALQETGGPAEAPAARTAIASPGVVARFIVAQNGMALFLLVLEGLHTETYTTSTRASSFALRTIPCRRSRIDVDTASYSNVRSSDRRSIPPVARAHRG